LNRFIHYNSGIQAHPTLSAALTDANGDPVQLNFTAAEKSALVAFLKTLTDDDLVNDIKFSDPFEVPLPIELLSFSVRLNEKKEVVLNWATASEMNADKFFIQKSKDGYSFENIGQVKAKGESSTIQNYFFLDENPYQGLTYYRFQQLDLDGTINYSDLRTVRKEESKDVHIYPNPLGLNQQLFIQSNSELPLRIELFTIQGPLVLAKQILNKQYLDLSELEPGAYVYKIENVEVETMGKLFIQ
jgi:hypothetical protein